MALTKKELGKLVKEAREIKSNKIGKKYTQQMLANDIDKSQSYIGDIESGRTYPSFVILNSIASVCGVPISFFEDRSKLNKEIETFIKLQLTNLNDTEIHNIREALKNDPEIKTDYIHEYIKTNYSSLNNLFETPESLIKFMLKHPAMIKFCGIDMDKLDKSELDNFATDLLSHLKLLSYKYKK
ncbi:helix-turn-helix transcriptional regulator [Clostridium sp. MB40-C1]|uniref:helix-turn-helix domain-containing protein n=1 Tax=Clostridium sp. MB40-C1 TaxID=3070996 RepID=UPI0027DEC3D9|nr:helix-turn-helix transcriptional regulator [Clostridium sp. MB40-C1]WMJ81454.1 helix-turn-helix transcriptional regulator [Clostridium sp. MB40-C1]